MGVSHQWRSDPAALRDRGIALILLAAAVAKAVALGSDPLARVGPWPLPRPLAAGAVAVELALAALLLGGAWPRLTRRITAALFAGFAAVAGALVVAGGTDCGCFGRLAVPPAVTLALDATVLLALAWPLPTPAAAPPRHRRGLASLALAALAGAVLAGAAAPGGSPGAAAIRPRLAPGQRFPGPPAAAGLAGSWVVVLYRDACPHCRSGFAAWVAQAQRDDRHRWAFVDVGREGDGDLLAASGGGALPHWRRSDPFLTTPLTLLVAEGVVQRLAEDPEAAEGWP